MRRFRLTSCCFECDLAFFLLVITYKLSILSLNFTYKCDKCGEKLYVQVTYLLASEETVNREFGVYDAIRDNFPKYVVSLDEFDMSRNGIKHRNIRDFLLSDKWD